MLVWGSHVSLFFYVKGNLFSTVQTQLQLHIYLIRACSRGHWHLWSYKPFVGCLIWCRNPPSSLQKMVDFQCIVDIWLQADSTEHEIHKQGSTARCYASYCTVTYFCDSGSSYTVNSWGGIQEMCVGKVPVQNLRCWLNVFKRRLESCGTDQRFNPKHTEKLLQAEVNVKSLTDGQSRSLGWELWPQLPCLSIPLFTLDTGIRGMQRDRSWCVMIVS